MKLITLFYNWRTKVKSKTPRSLSYFSANFKYFSDSPWDKSKEQHCFPMLATGEVVNLMLIMAKYLKYPSS